MRKSSPSPAQLTSRDVSASALVGTTRGRSLLALGTLITTLALAACASSPRLLDERRTEPYAGLLAQVDATRVEHRLIRVAPGDGPPLTIGLQIVHAPHGAAKPVLVLQPGILADGTTWRFLVGALAQDNDLLVIDPPGCGASDRPSPACQDGARYSPSWLAECTLLVLRDFEARQARPRRLILVGHSLGGTVVLRMLAQPDLRARYADVMGRVDRAVLLDPADLALTKADPRFLEIRDLPDWKATLAIALGIVRRNVEKAVYDGVVDPEHRALRQEADRMCAMLTDTATRHAAQAMLRRFQPTDQAGCPDRAAIRRLADEERSIRVPILVLWGERDDTFPLADAAPIFERLTSERLVIVPAAKHSSHQEAARFVAGEIKAFADGPSAMPAPAAPRVPATAGSHVSP